MDYQKILEAVIMVAQDAGYGIDFDRNFRVKQKGDIANIVTSMDVKIQGFILDRLKEILPQAKVFAEEEGIRNYDDGLVWVVDPIDGTTNYAYDCKHSCISIALLNHHEGVIGVVYDPYLHETFYAVANQGAFLNGRPLHVNEYDLSSSLTVVGTSPYRKELADVTFANLKKLFVNTRDLRRSGSAALDLCYVACGRFDCFYESNLSPWDYGAASTIIKEAGGLIDAIKPDTWGFDKPIGVIAGTPSNFEGLRKIIE